MRHRPVRSGLRDAGRRAARQPASYAARMRSAAIGAGSSPESTAARTSSRIGRDRGRATQSLVELVAHQRPGEVELLAGALAEQPVLAEVLAVGEDALPDVVDTGPGEGRAGDDRGRPLPPAVDEPQGPGELAGGAPRLLLAVAVGLVDRDHVGDLQDALLDPLELVAGAGEGEEQERVDHPGDGDLGLPDADRLDQHHVVPGGLEHQHRLGGGPGDAAQGARRRGGADVGVRVDGQRRHPGLVAQHRAAGAHRRRVDREHADPVAGGGQGGAQRLDEGGLADAGDPGDADPRSSPRCCPAR